MSVIVCETRKLSMAPTPIKHAAVVSTRGRLSGVLRADNSHGFSSHSDAAIVFNADMNARNASQEMISGYVDHTLTWQDNNKAGYLLASTCRQMEGKSIFDLNSSFHLRLWIVRVLFPSCYLLAKTLWSVFSIYFLHYFAKIENWWKWRCITFFTCDLPLNLLVGTGWGWGSQLNSENEESVYGIFFFNFNLVLGMTTQSWKNLHIIRHQ